MSRSSTAQRTGPFRLPLISASQEKQTECWRRWGFNRLDGFKEPESPAMANGTAYHAEMEAWSLFGTLPTSKPALAALKYAPPRGLGAGIEVPVRFDTPSSPWVGYIDACFDWEPDPHSDLRLNHTTIRLGRMRELCATGWTVIQDYKFTGDLKNAKTAEELLEDSAANIYAHEAFLGGAERVSGRWVYVQMKGSPSVKVVWFEFVRESVERIMAELDAKAGRIQGYYAQYRKGEITTLDLPYDTGQCYSFRKQCPHMTERCNPDLTVSFSLSGATQMQDFKDAIIAGFPTEGAALNKLPPKLPPKLPTKPIDAAWAQHTKDLTTPDSGFVNPPEAPKVAAASPEHAAELQGITKPVAESEDLTQSSVRDIISDDDLAGYSRDQLKALAVQLGAVPENSRAREPALREGIRGARAAGMTTGFNTPEFQDKALQIVQEAAVEASVASIAAGSDIDVPRLPPKLPPRLPPKKEEIEESILDKVALAAESLALRRKFFLYVNCAPTLRSLEMHDVLPEAYKIVKEQRGVDDYRLIGYGEGAGVLCLAVRAMHENGYFDRFDSLVVDSRTVEGAVLLETLSSFADEIVRGF